MLKHKQKIIFLVGPTAVGKSALAVELAKRLGAEIVSLDSMQIYKGLDILSSKPTEAMQKKINHHLLSFVAVGKDFSVAAYRRSALRIIKDAQRRGKIPLFVGGSGLYMSILLDGIFRGVTKDDTLRKKLYAKAKQFGNVYLHKKLSEVDIESASKIHPNDLRRIVRALEVYQLTKKPLSKLKLKRRGLSDKYDIKLFGLNKQRQQLYLDINNRVDEMFTLGLVDEVRRLLDYKLSHTCKQAIGIKEVKGYLEGVYDLDYAKELLKKNTRHYAKRQLTWFRKDKRIDWVDAADKEIKIVNKIARLVKHG